MNTGGRLIFINSSMIDIPRTIALMEECAMTVRILGETSGPFRDYYFEDGVHAGNGPNSWGVPNDRWGAPRTTGGL